jgi:glucose-6-phosphate isomerase
MAPASDLTMHVTGFDGSAIEKRAVEEHLVERLSCADPSLWAENEQDQREISPWLGWLRITERLRHETNELSDWGAKTSRNIDDVVLLGMGGSSLAPEVMAAMLPAAPGRPKLTVLDSTDPATVLRVSDAIDLRRTLFVVASKSGDTAETCALYATFRDQYIGQTGLNAGSHFIAITDPGTSLENRARSEGFARLFLNDPEIGGRYSALSYFGLVPAALIGLDVANLLNRAHEFSRISLTETDLQANSAIRLGLVLGALAKDGRDKMTLACSSKTRAIGAWIEQLLAESTGKLGRGIVPVDGEPISSPFLYGDDRLFVGIFMADEPCTDMESLARAGHPVIRLPIAEAYNLGVEFFRWEVATAVACWVLEVNPFNQPNVDESKANTSGLLGPKSRSAFMSDGLGTNVLHAPDMKGLSVGDTIKHFFDDAASTDYVSIQAYIDRIPAHEAPLRHVQAKIRDRTKLATTLGFGPRFLHSTGQLHKGGSNTGLFVQLTAEHPRDVHIPGETYTFAALIDAQAKGDFQSLRGKKRRVLRLVTSEPRRGLLELADIVGSSP